MNPVSAKPFFLAVLVVILIAAYMDDARADWTLHTVSYHVQFPGARDTDRLNNFNPGLAYDVTDIFRVGAFYNSYKKPSVYGAFFLPLGDRFRVGAGLVSGYAFEQGSFRVEGHTAGVIPLIAAEFDVTKHVSVAWFGQAFNLELKW
jgi:hypothetical protein